MQAPTDFPCIPVDLNDVQTAVNTSFELGVQYGVAIASSSIANADTGRGEKRQRDPSHGKYVRATLCDRQSSHILLLHHSLYAVSAIWCVPSRAIDHMQAFWMPSVSEEALQLTPLLL